MQTLMAERDFHPAPDHDSDASRRASTGDTFPFLDRPLGDVVRQWRIARGRSSAEFAGHAGLSRSYVSEVEHNRIKQPRKEKLQALAKALDLSVFDLVIRRMPGERADRADTSVRQAQTRGSEIASRPSTAGAVVDALLEEIKLPPGKKKQLEEAMVVMVQAICKLVVSFQKNDKHF